MRISAKEKEGIVKVTVLAKHPMLTYDQAKKKGKEANFITGVEAKVGDKVVFEVSSSQFLSKNPVLKFKCPGKKGETLSITWKDLSGQSVTESKVIR